VKLDFVGNPYIGVYCASNDDILIASPNVSKTNLRLMSDALETEAFNSSIGGSTVVGSLLSLNSHGAIVTEFVTEGELEILKDINVFAIPHKLNAMGNNILCNDRGALIHPGYDKKFMVAIADVLDIEVVRGTIAGIKTVGSWAVATNKGVLCHPHVRDEEKIAIENVLKVPVVITTANYGTAQIGACMVANSRGAIVGSRTTPIEIGRIEDGLGLY